MIHPLGKDIMDRAKTMNDEIIGNLAQRGKLGNGNPTELYSCNRFFVSGLGYSLMDSYLDKRGKAHWYRPVTDGSGHPPSFIVRMWDDSTHGLRVYVSSYPTHPFMLIARVQARRWGYLPSDIVVGMRYNAKKVQIEICGFKYLDEMPVEPYYCREDGRTRMNHKCRFDSCRPIEELIRMLAEKDACNG